MSDSVKSAAASEPEPKQRPEIATVVQLPSSLSGEDSASAESLVRLMKLASARGKDRLQTIAKMAEGGMGQIHLAVDHVLQRRVAKKVINPELKKDLLHVRMFVREAQIVSQLDHPSIVPLHEMGVDDAGLLYFTMKLVRGRTLSEMIRELSEDPIPPALLFSLLETVVKVCDALALAHSRGVIHCDVKPANIMVGDYGEVYLMDWGVAQLMPNRSGQPSSGDDQGKKAPPTPCEESELEEAVSLGTLGYMSPEQLVSGELTPATDIFCLGGVLYEILTRRAPYAGFSTNTAMVKIHAADFRVPEDVVGPDRVPPGLRRIVMTAMAADPADRYESAVAFKQDVLRFMRGDGAFERQTFKAGTVIVMEGDAGNCAYIIESGKCDVFRVVQGERVTLGFLGPGDVFGEMAVLSPGPRTANVVAVDDVVAQVVHGEILKRELDSMRPWMGLVVRRLADRLREDGTPVDAPQAKNVIAAQQVTMYLCTWGQRGPGRTLSAELSQVAQSLSERLNSSEEGIKAALADFPGLQHGGNPIRVWMRDPPATLGALWRAEETSEDVSNATHRDLAEKIAMYLCTWGRPGPGRRLSGELETLCHELAPRIGGKEEILRAAIADYPQFHIDEAEGRVVLDNPKTLLTMLWPRPGK